MGSHALLQGIFQTQRLNRSPALQADSLPSEPPGKPKNTGMCNLFLLQGVFPTQESNQGLLHCTWILCVLCLPICITGMIPWRRDWQPTPLENPLTIYCLENSTARGPSSKPIATAWRPHHYELLLGHHRARQGCKGQFCSQEKMYSLTSLPTLA